MRILAIPDRGLLSWPSRSVRGRMENRTACIVMGIVLIAVGALITPLLCGAGFLLLIIGAVMWVRED